MKVEYQIGTMIELPRACIAADKIAEEAEFFSFGTNDLTQMTFGFSRDDIKGFMPTYLRDKLLPIDPFQTIDFNGVGELMKIGIQKGRDSRRAKHNTAPEGGHLRGARRRPGERGVLPQDRDGLRELLAVPGADRAARGGAGRARRGREARQVTVNR